MLEKIHQILEEKYPDKVYHRLSDLYQDISEKEFKKEAQKRGLRPSELIYQMGYDRYNRYDLLTIEILLGDYDFNQADIGKLLGVSRQAVHEKLSNIDEEKYPNRNVLWTPMTLSVKDVENIQKMIRENKWYFETEKKRYRLISNFNQVEEKTDVKIILMTYDLQTKQTHLNYDLPIAIQRDLTAYIYPFLPEHSHKQLPELKKEILSTLEEDQSLSYQSMTTINTMIKDTLFTNHRQFLKAIELDHIQDYVDKRFADEDRFEKLIKKYYDEESQLVKIPSRSKDYAYLANQASRKGVGIKDFIHSFGYTYDKTIDDSKVRERVLRKIRKRIVYDRYIYLASTDPLYNSLNSSAYKVGISLDDFLFEKYQYQRIAVEDLPDGYEVYDWSVETNEDFDEEIIKEYIDSYLLNEKGIVELEKGSDFFQKLVDYCRERRITIEQLMDEWSYSYKILTTPQQNKRRLLKEIQALDTEIRRITNQTNKLSRNKILVKKMKELYDYQCQVCGVDGPHRIQMKNGKNYVEMHHIRPLTDFQDDSAVNDESDLLDHYQNVVVLCAHHHKYVHYYQGGFQQLKGSGKRKYFEDESGDRLPLALNEHL